MEAVNHWCKLVTSVSVISAVASLIIPEGSIKKAFNTLMSTILVFALIYPLNGKTADTLSLKGFDKDYFSVSADNEIENYSGVALVKATESEIKKYIAEFAGNCKVDVVCEYKKEKVRIVKINITGNIDDEDKSIYYSEIIKICDSNTVIEFNGEKYE